MSKTKQQSVRGTLPLRRWRQVPPSRLTGLAVKAEFRPIDDGCIEIRFDYHGHRVAAKLTRAQLEDPGSIGPANPTDVLQKEVAVIAELVRQGLSAKAPRGTSAKVAAPSAAVKCAAQDVFLHINATICPNPWHLRHKQPPPPLPGWMLKLVAAAVADGVDVGGGGRAGGSSDTRNYHLPDAVSLTAYAIAKLSGIDWKRTGLKCPITDGIIEREYFQKHYLSGHDTVTVPGIALTLKIMAQIDRSWSPEASAPIDSTQLLKSFALELAQLGASSIRKDSGPRTPRRLPRWLELERKRFIRFGNRVTMKMRVFRQLSEQLDSSS
jgi:hypothetical protein